jgi:hypothetical protein
MSLLAWLSLAELLSLVVALHSLEDLAVLILFIGNAIPDNYNLDNFISIENISDLRAVCSKYSSYKKQFPLNLDLRSYSNNDYSGLLKLSEDSDIEITIWLNEPVVNTLLSRASRIVKKDLVKKVSYLDYLTHNEDLKGKIRGLK